MRRSLGLALVASVLLVITGPDIPEGLTGSPSTPAPEGSALPTATAATSRGDAPPPSAAAPSMAQPQERSGEAAAEGAVSDDGPEVVPGPTDVNALLRGVPGATTVAGGTVTAGRGPAYRFSVEVETVLELDIDSIATIVETALLDTDRSWARDRTLQRVADPSEARLRVVIATPGTVDAICATVGLDTAGIYSCWTGRIAALNAMRWESGATGFDDISAYRSYLVNHEVGHALGYAHVGCPAAGQLAPVMMQQTKGLDGCRANGWPHP